MLKMEIIKFDPQDVVTASVAAVVDNTPCICTAACFDENKVFVGHDGVCTCPRTLDHTHPEGRVNP